ncbi:MAG: hypothetical protein ACLFVJ_23275 [Persicimonas sp.]
MGKIYYGCDELPRGWEQYFKLCNAVELDLDPLDAPPKTSTLNRWRVDSPRGFGFVLHADRGFREGLADLADRGATELNARVRKGWETTVERAHALAAKAILIKTPPEFFPGSVSRGLLELVAEEFVGPAKQAVIWDSQGPWQLDQTRDYARDLGMIYAYDPFIAHREEVPFTHGDTCWVLTERAGLRRKFDQFDMETLTAWADHYDRAFVLLRGRFKWDHARELKMALEYAD